MLRLANINWFFWLLFLSLFWSSTSLAQDWNNLAFEKIDKGISNKWIYSIAQDDLGFMWIGTEDGLNRYDGYSFDILRSSPENPNSIPANWVMDIATLSNNTIWLATRGGGLSLFSPKEMRFKNYAKDYNSNFYFVNSIKVFPNRDLAIVCGEGVFIYSNETDTFAKVEVGGSKSKIAILGNSLWFSKKDQLYEYDVLKRKVVSQHSLDENVLMLNSLQHGLLIGTNNSLIYFADQTIVKRTQTPEPLVHFAKKGELSYLASNKNIYQLDLKTFTLHKWQGLLSEKGGDITSIFIDKQDQLWIGKSDGLYKEKSLQTAFQNSPIPIRARQIVKYGKKLYAGGESGLYMVDSVGQHKLLDVVVHSLIESNGVLWTSNAKGEVYKIEDDVVQKPINLTENKRPFLPTFGLEQDDKNRVWVGAWNGIYVLSKNGSEKKFFNLKNKSNNGEAKIIGMFIDSKDRLWLITAAYGLYLLEGVSSLNIDELEELPFINFTHDINSLTSISSDVLLDLDEDDEGNIWFGSDVGVFMFNEKAGNFTRLRDGTSLFDKKIMTIRSDGENNLWITTISNGVYKYNQLEKKLSNFTMEDGLVSNDFLFSSGFYDKAADEMYFGSENGIQQISLIEDIVLTEKFAPQISDFIIQNRKTPNPLFSFASPYNNEFALLHFENDFSIRFSNLDLKYSKKIQYAYSLDDNKWRTTDLQTAYFSNIPYGDHSLKVKAVYSFGESSEKEDISTINLKIIPPWYLSWWAYWLYGFLICVVLFTIYYLLLKQRLASTEIKRTKEFDTIKSKMYANISHEFRTPLTIINGLTDSLFDLKTNTPKSVNKLTGIKQSSNQLLHLVNQMLDLVSLDSQKLDANYKSGDFVHFVQECVSFYQSYADSKGQKIIFSSEVDHLIMDIDDDKLQKVINNIVSNAIKFTPQNGEIRISIKISSDKKRVSLDIGDTGKGISPEHLPHIFDRYFMTFDIENNIGNGIGMALTKELTELLNGTIHVESEVGFGSNFTVILPITNKAKTSQTLEYNIPFTDDINEYQDLDASFIDKEMYSILLVEDNKRVRDYLRELLSDQYHLHLAHNGKKGLEIANSKKIDFIISDVMMPVMDGFEFCRQIKNQVETSHLPFIMITAKVEVNDKLKGYKLGVDAYLNKPFNNRELLAIIENLITKKEQQKDYYRKLLKLPDNTTNYNQLDIDFINKIQQIALNKNLKLSADDLSKELFTSRTQLHRKIKALTGMSITEYFNHIRVEKAKELLENTSLTISEIAYEIGYQDISYFSKIFKKTYGMSPSAFRGNLQQ